MSLSFLLDHHHLVFVDLYMVIFIWSLFTQVQQFVRNGDERDNLSDTVTLLV